MNCDSYGKVLWSKRKVIPIVRSYGRSFTAAGQQEQEERQQLQLNII